VSSYFPTRAGSALAQPKLLAGPKPTPAAAPPPPVKVVKVRAHTRAVPVKAKPAPQAKPAAPSSSTQSVQPVDRSTVKRFAPNFATEPVAGHVQGLRNPDGSWVKPGGKFQPGAHLALRPYYTNTFTLKRGAGPPGQESTQLNAAQVATAKKIQVANYGKPGYIARSLVPGGLDEGGTTSPVQAVKRGVEAATTVLPGGGAIEAAGVLGYGLKVLRTIPGVKNVVEAAPAAAHTTEAAATVRGALPGAKIARGKQEAGYTPARAQRVAAGQAHLDNPNLSAAEAFAKARAEQRGPLPKINFLGFGDLNEKTLQEAQTSIRNHPNLGFYQKLNASHALVNALGGTVPTRSEILLLEHVFGKGTGEGLVGLAKNPGREALVNALNIPRSLMASFDLSAPFRQGLMVATRHPTIFGRNFGSMVKAFGSEKVYHGIHDEIRARATYPLMVEAKLPITELGHDVGGREERFASSYAETLTGGKYSPVRASGRAYTGFLDKTRADVFDHLIKSAQSQGVNIHDPHFLESLGTYIGSATGRGELRTLAPAANALNAVFFSPRLMASRLNFLNPAYYARLHPFARKEALRSAIQLAGTASTLLGLASQIPGVKVNTDPRNPDWGKIRIGNTRIDIAGGFQQELRLLAQFASGVAISSTTGKRLSLTAGGFGKPTRLDIVQRFFMGKESPIASLITDWMRGSTQIGQKFSWKAAAAQRMIPLLAQDSHDLYKEQHGGMNGLMAAFAGYGVGSVGIGMQTYGPQAPKTKPSTGYFGTSGGSGGGSPYFSGSSSSGGSGYFAK